MTRNQKAKTDKAIKAGEDGAKVPAARGDHGKNNNKNNNNTEATPSTNTQRREGGQSQNDRAKIEELIQDSVTENATNGTAAALVGQKPDGMTVTQWLEFQEKIMNHQAKLADGLQSTQTLEMAVVAMKEKALDMQAKSDAQTSEFLMKGMKMLQAENDGTNQLIDQINERQRLLMASSEARLQILYGLVGKTGGAKESEFVGEDDAEEGDIEEDLGRTDV